MARRTSDPGIKHGFRSGLEDKIAAELTSRGVTFRYEAKQDVISWTSPPEEHRYTPDFVLPNGIIVETKGRFVTADRKKHKLIKAQHPHLDIRFVFSNANARISKTSTTTYAKWCEQFGFKYANKTIPAEWLK